MNQPEYSVRRATVDDVKSLVKLWESASLPALDMERRLTEFQVVVQAHDNLVGAIGLHIEGKNGKLHSEAFADPQQIDALRPKLWERMVTVGKNHGLFRLWTLQSAPFWEQVGFKPAPEEWLKKIPNGFGESPLPWFMMHMREESVEAISLEKEFELFQQQQVEATQEMMKQARVFKV